MHVIKKVLHLYQVNHCGRENAITREEFLNRYSVLLGEPSDRKLRRIYSFLPILTCGRGGFWPARGAEVVTFLSDMEKRREALKRRKIRTFRAHKRLLGAPEQKRLPGL